MTRKAADKTQTGTRKGRKSTKAQNAPVDGGAEPRILELRGQKVVLDADLAALYGVTTKRFNEQVKRNAQRFPGDFMFQLTRDEWANLRSQIVTSSSQTIGTTDVAILRSQNATSSC